MAFSIICFHSTVVSYGAGGESTLWLYLRPVIGLILPAFFALSGFLVAGSLERTKTVVGFVGLRVLRLVPALAVEVVLSALLLGAAFTTLPLAAYFQDPDLPRYFLNIVGDIQYYLPGVFLGNPLPGKVNLQLWTIPWELRCYLLLTILALVGLLRFRRFTLAFAIALPFVWSAITVLRHHGDQAIDAGVVAGPVLVGSFMAGVALFRLRDKVPNTLGLFCAAALASVLLLSVPYGELFCPLPAAYATVYLGLSNPPKWRPLRRGDYSYGVYLFGFAIQQAVAALGPWTHQWWIDLLIAAPLTVLVAALSWHFVEKPALKLRTGLAALEARWIGLAGKAPWMSLPVRINHLAPAAPSPRADL